MQVFILPLDPALAILVPSKHFINGSQNISSRAFPFSKNIIPSQNRTSSCYSGELYLKNICACVSKLQELKMPLHTEQTFYELPIYVVHFLKYISQAVLCIE